ncbi:uncharacterized protein LOC62_02G002295 [Vanrija pseudolonga]|uniref:Ecp2 effector protein domain-containing protein n=1 Tax=Vanrija pseudolonga TaxID=143232 RepID=A0AAF0Y6K7_9TREE|nr:hypothetical protein LOC62_02G002295 [Vanrija pseudolonga]
MLLHSVALTLLATLATAAPAANPLINNNDAASGAARTPEVAARDSVEPFDSTGISIRCYDGLDCTGDIVFTSGDWNGIKPGWSYSWGFQHDSDRRVSCRFDTWNDLKASFWVSAYWIDHVVSQATYSEGWGQSCVNQLENTTESLGNIEKIAVLFRNPN